MELTEMAIAAARQLASPSLIGHFVSTKAIQLAVTNDAPETQNAASELADEAVAAAKESQDSNSMGHALGNRALICTAYHRIDQAVEDNAEALVHYRSTGDRLRVAHTLSNLADAEMALSRFDDAHVHLDESILIFCEVRAHAGLQHSYANLTLLAILEHRWIDCYRPAMDSMMISRNSGERNAMAVSLLLHALRCTGIGEHRHAAFLHGAHDALTFPGERFSIYPIEMELRSRDIDLLIDILGNSEFESLRDTGRKTRSLDEAVLAMKAWGFS